MKKNEFFCCNILIVLVMMLLLSACSSKPKGQLMLMPAPDVFDRGDWDPFTDHNPIEDIPYGGILYATDRQPDLEEGGYYLNDRGHVLRLGVAQVTQGKEGMTWAEARKISLLKDRPEGYPLKITGITEDGVLDRSTNSLTELTGAEDQRHIPGREFAAKINAKLHISQQKDVFIYVHGYKVVFENPLLVASELWHFLGYEGSFIAFSWPSTPDTLAYFGDLETAALSAGSLRVLIQYLAEQTEAQRIHIIGYSAGTRVVAQALDQLALIHSGMADADGSEKWRIGQVILTGSDIDQHLFGSYLMDGILDVVDGVTIYASSKDSALGVSKWLFGRDRLGQVVNSKLSKRVKQYLWQNNKLVIIDASDTPGADSGNGHAYFRQSPWTSSDILATLALDLKPGDRGLERLNDSPIWSFSENYVGKLHTAIEREESKRGLID